MNFAKEVVINFGDKPITTLLPEDRKVLDNLKKKKSNPITLTNVEKCWLSLLLKGWDINKMASHLEKSVKYLKPEISKKIYRYVYVLTNNKVTDWSQVRLYLEIFNAAYRLKDISVREEPIDISITISSSNLNLNQINHQKDFLLQKINGLLEEQLEIKEIVIQIRLKKPD